MKHNTTLPVSVPKLIQDYLSWEEQLEPYCSVRPELNELLAYSKRKAFPAKRRRVIVDVLKEQAGKSKYASDVTRKQIELLSEDDANTVVTGHQLCIYGGPMFFPYKILSAVRLAKRLNDEGAKVVPVYWMASEDHDFEEVNHVYIGEKKFQWDRPSGGAVGPMTLEGIEQFQKELRSEFEQDPVRQDTLKVLESIYRPDRTLAQATQDLVYWLFGDLGVVVIDAADPRLKSEFKDVLKQELLTNDSLEAVTQTTQELTDLGYGGQVTPREINLFWMEEGLRSRIVRTSDGFATPEGDRNWSRDEMLDALEKYPERFSPNVVMRPVYQEFILPNLAYIGGPGELSYWLQLKGVFDRLNVEFPSLVLRDMAVLLDERTAKRMSQLGLGERDVYGDQVSLFKELVRKEGSHEHWVEEAREQVKAELESMMKEIDAFDPTLGESARAEEKRILNRLEVLRKKVLRADKRQHDTTNRRLQEILSSTYPNSSPQERVHHWLMYTQRDSMNDFWAELLVAFDPLSPGLKVFH